MEKDSNRLELLDEIFRAAHTLKGMSATMGYDPVAQLTHKMESLLEKIKERKILLNQEIVNTLFQCVDALEKMLLMIREGETPELDLKNLLKKLNNLEKSQVIKEVEQERNKQKSPPKFQQEELESGFNEYEINVIHEALSKGFNVWKIMISLSPDCLMKSVRAFMVFRNLESLGEIIKAVPPVQDIEDEKFDREFTLFLVSKEESTEIEQALNISEIAIKSMEKVKVKKSKGSVPHKPIKTKNKTQFASGKSIKFIKQLELILGVWIN